jgi:hypothetical protein
MVGWVMLRRHEQGRSGLKFRAGISDPDIKPAYRLISRAGGLGRFLYGIFIFRLAAPLESLCAGPHLNGLNCGIGSGAPRHSQ